MRVLMRIMRVSRRLLERSGEYESADEITRLLGRL